MTVTTLISFNVNGVRARPHQLEAVKNTYHPDILGLQEIKVQDSEFPLESVEALGFHVEHFGQKGHYGVALLSKVKPEFVQKGWPWDDEDAQKRIIDCRYNIDGKIWDVLNGYFPQGENRKHETKFPAKEKFYGDLQRYLDEYVTATERVVLMCDMKISPEDIDIGIGEANRKGGLSSGTCSFFPEESEWDERLLGFGLKDCYRKHYPESTELYSWFDY